MKLATFLCALALCVAVVLADPRLSLEPGISTVSSYNWRASTTPPPRDATMVLFMMMRHEKADLVALEDTLMAVSDPSSPRYGKHLSIQQLGELTPISAEKLDAVYSFLPTTAQVKANPNKDILRVELSVEEVETLFQTTVARFVHNLSGKSLLRASTTYTVPASLTTAITLVGDLTGLPRIDGPIRTPAPVKDSAAPWPNACTGLAGCDGLVTPAVLKQRYNVPADGGKGLAVNNSFSVAEFQGQYFIPSDISTFASGCNVNVTVDKVIGGNTPSAGVEAELDIEYIGGVSPDIPLTVIYAQEYSLLDWVNTVNSLKDAPWVHSVSYGNDEKQQSSPAYMDSCNVQFQKAGARGISILFASGDQGVCGREGCGLINPRFKPDFPGDSPYITTVGGTDFLNDGIGEEKTWSDSGGGFSDHFAIPSWQAKAVAAYKANPAADLPKQSFWNNTGRGYPDIAALGGQKNSYCVVTSGKAAGVAGTSASCPTAASIFARLNGERLAAGKSTLGWLNPFIYQNPTAFNDVKTGNNKCSCGLFATNGFTATEGWDPTTGFGTPNYTALAKASLAALDQAEQSRFDSSPEVSQF